MLYYVQPGDTLSQIANKFNTSLEALIDGNVICNPNLIFPNQPLIIEKSEEVVFRAGATPYYIVQPGDSLWCLSKLYNIPFVVLAEVNRLHNPNLIYPGTELLIGDYRGDPEELMELWQNTGDTNCDELSSLQIHGIFYLGSFKWEALNKRSVPYLLELLNHPCDIVRFYSAYSLGKIGLDEGVIDKLSNTLKDPESYIANMAKVSLKRINLVSKKGPIFHVTTRTNNLYNQPDSASPSISLPMGAEINVLRWAIPSETKEEGPRGDLQIYDYIQVTDTDKVGYIARVGFNELAFV